MADLLNTIGVIKPGMSYNWMITEVMLRPLISYNIQLLKQCCKDVVVVSSDEKFGEVARTYDVSFVRSEDQVVLGHRITLTGLNPCLDRLDLEKAIDYGGCMLIDAMGYEVAKYLDGGVEISLPIESGLACINHERLAMMNGYLPSRLQRENLPIEINASYEVEKRGVSGKPKMLFSAPYAFFLPELKEILMSNFDITFAYRAPEAVVKELLRDAETWVTSTCPPYYMGHDMIECGKNLKIIATPSTGTNHIDVKSAVSKGINVLSIKESSVIEEISASSEFSLTLLLAMVNQLPAVTSAANLAVWREREADFRSFEFQGKTIGLLGYGRIGRRMASYARTLDMHVVVFDPFKSVDDPTILQCDTREELLEKADIVSLHYHLNDQTKGQFGEKEFMRMRRGSFFLNTARGELVNELAMIHSLESGHLRAAAVDVISNEHEVNKWNHPVIKYARTNDNLIVSPHVAGLTVDSESKAMKDLVEQILSVS